MQSRPFEFQNHEKEALDEIFECFANSVREHSFVRSGNLQDISSSGQSLKASYSVSSGGKSSVQPNYSEFHLFSPFN
jgi:hypothetical protein